MLKIQSSYAQYLSEAAVLLEKTNVSTESLPEIKYHLSQTELLIPVIGSFSSGKSSLLNALLGRPILPVGISPETDLATELRPSSDERVEAVSNDGKITRFSLEEMHKIKPRADEFSHLKLYVNSDVLRRISPLVLVDMPGFDSTLANHNKAISRYIGSGAHYFTLVSVEEGTITKSIQRHLKDINALGQSFSFFVSKANLKPADELADIVLRIKDQAELLFGNKASALPLGYEDVEQLAVRLREIDPEALYEKIHGGTMKDIHFDLTDSVGFYMSGLQKNVGECEDTIQEMQQTLDRIVDKRDNTLAEVQSRY
ncbi:dynamin family protein [Vreelandella glaciei]|uniref:dynamin family protein n=1 Tax=Vreelandella glaciei TaxID=186761 RepID=UPI0030EB66EE|tara:strand:+ start:5609 stop:6550 length:942 start_codon:yes stop_codon:yes gene_type:complete